VGAQKNFFASKRRVTVATPLLETAFCIDVCSSQDHVEIYYLLEELNEN